MKMEDSKRRAAYHEAGHAVMSLILGLPFQSVSIKTVQLRGEIIEGDKKTDANFTICEGLTHDEENNKAANKAVMDGILDIREALTSMAGPLAEIIFIGKIDNRAKEGASIDVQRIIDCCRAAINEDPDGEAKNTIPQMEQHLVSAIDAGAESLMREYWSIVEAVAKGLLEKKELKYEEVSKIAEAKGLFKKRNRR